MPPMSELLQAAAGFPVRDLETGDVLIQEGSTDVGLYVLIEGTLAVTRDGTAVASITEPGSVIGEISALLATEASATVTATSDVRLHAVDDPMTTLLADRDTLVVVARELAQRLQRMVAYLADIKEQYGDESGHLGMVDEVLGQLVFGRQESVESGSEREPDPYY